MIAPVLILSTCALAAAVAQPYGYGWQPNGFGFPTAFPQYGNFPNTGFQAWIPAIQNNGPWVSTEDGIYQIVAKAENYKVDDLRVKIKDNTIAIRGDAFGSNSKSFSFSYTLPQDANGNKATAVLTRNGYLIVKIPLTGSAGEVERVVPITISEETYKRSD